MAGTIDLATYTFTASERGALAAVDNRGRQMVYEQFGSGYPLFRGGRQRDYRFHNEFHTNLDVANFTKMDERLRLPEAIFIAGSTALRYHDVVQGQGRGNNEDKSIEVFEREVAKERALGLELKSAVVGLGALVISGTKNKLLPNGNIVQEALTVAKNQPQPTRIAVLRAATADMAHIHSAMGPYLGAQMFWELNPNSKDRNDPQKLIKYYGGQATLVRAYRYPEAVGEHLFGKLRPAVLEHTLDVLADMRAGLIGSLDEAIVRHEAFMRQHRK